MLYVWQTVSEISEFLHSSRWNCTHSTWFNLHDLFLKNILKYMDMFVLLI